MKKKILYLFMSLILVLIGFFILTPESVNYCINCFDNSLTFDIGQPLFFAFIPFILLLTVALFFKEERVKSNYIIFNIYIGVFIVLVYLLPRNCNIFTPFCPSKTIITFILSVVFVLYSSIKIYKNK